MLDHQSFLIFPTQLLLLNENFDKTVVITSKYTKESVSQASLKTHYFVYVNDRNTESLV